MIIVGPSGSGTSTALNVIAGLEEEILREYAGKSPTPAGAWHGGDRGCASG
jgi:ABC-type nitrate/sulfonate/bicarbonate transport system ATPase subunit